VEESLALIQEGDIIMEEIRSLVEAQDIRKNVITIKTQKVVKELISSNHIATTCIFRKKRHGHH
jgi:ethanolamine utilization protein EutQ (cupin superfamily)